LEKGYNGDKRDKIDNISLDVSGFCFIIILLSILEVKK